jgi:hypothetical protein
MTFAAKAIASHTTETPAMRRRTFSPHRNFYIAMKIYLATHFYLR